VAGELALEAADGLELGVIIFAGEAAVRLSGRRGKIGVCGGQRDT
jgi:hypothetical protein